MRDGIPGFAIVGLADRACQEARERVRSGISAAELSFPPGRITVNLAPAELRKEGSGFDLPIALALLAASQQLPRSALERTVAVGELALDGRLRRVGGVLAVAEGARRLGAERLLCPADSAREAALAGVAAIPIRHLAEAAAYLRGELELEPEPPIAANGHGPAAALDLADVGGQERARRALELAAAGGHNVLLGGPPGTGKTMLARRLPGILPPLDSDAALEVTRIHSVAGLVDDEHPLVSQAPFRAPHHSASTAAIVGGGPHLRPGEASLAHRGVLLLDELAEFQRPALEALRQPLEDGFVSVARAAGRVVFPARFMLVGTMNLCPCGGRGDPAAQCSCSAQRLARYRDKLSRALLDRFDRRAYLERLAAAGHRFLPRSSPDFPPLLRAIHDPPAGLFLRGVAKPELLAQPAVAIVGARASSGYGSSVARALGRELAAAGLVVVSGLARGIDAEAHRGALEARGTTVAVLGCGIDRDYPAAHAELARRVAEAGVIASEYAPGVEPAPWRFPARNRIVAGLCAATIVVEARERSGALITADFALEEGREVFAVPGEITSSLSAGTNALLKLGAAPLTSAGDVLTSFGIEPEAEPAEASPLLELLPASADELVRRTGLGASEIARALVELELAGLVTAADGVYRSLGFA